MPFIRKVRVLSETRLIFPRINGPIVILFGTSVVLVTVGNWNEYRKGHSELFTGTGHQVMKNY